MSSTFVLLWGESRGVSHAEKERTVWKDAQIQKMTTIFTQKRHPRTIFSENSCHFVNMLSFASTSFFLSLRKITWLNLQQPKTRGHVDHPSYLKLGLNFVDSYSQVNKSPIKKLFEPHNFFSKNQQFVGCLPKVWTCYQTCLDGWK